MKKKKYKLNWVAVGNLIGLISSLLFILNTLYHLIFKMQTLTYFGLGLTIIAFIVFGSNFTYFEERID